MEVEIVSWCLCIYFLISLVTVNFPYFPISIRVALQLIKVKLNSDLVVYVGTENGNCKVANPPSQAPRTPQASYTHKQLQPAASN